MEDASKETTMNASESEKPLKWLVAPVWQTLASFAPITVCGLFIYAHFRPINPEYPTPAWGAMIAAGAASLFIRKVMLGGCVIDFENQRFIRWWGPLLPIVRKVIPIERIAAVHVGYGLYPHSVRVARGQPESCYLAIEIEGTQWLIKQCIPTTNSALAIARDLAVDLDARLVNHLDEDNSTKLDLPAKN